MTTKEFYESKLPNLPDYVPLDEKNNYIFSGLTTEQLKECWSICEQQKRACHPESPFQPLIDEDMREIVAQIKKIKATS